MTILATKVRAAGIFLVLIAQRPDKDVLPMQVRDNLGNRLALKLETEASSKDGFCTQKNVGQFVVIKPI